MAWIGLLLFIGLDRRTAEPRFTFGALDLQMAASTRCPLFSVFAIVSVFSSLPSAAARASPVARFFPGSLREGVFAEEFPHYGPLLRSSITGALIGMIPAIGGTGGGFIAYGQAVQTSKDRSRFGHGDIRGVISRPRCMMPSGSLAPTLAFGLSRQRGHGRVAGGAHLAWIRARSGVTEESVAMAFVLIWSLFYSNWLTSIMGVLLARPLASMSEFPIARLAPFVLMFAALGAYSQQGRFSDVILAFGLRLAGYYLRKHGWPPVPMVTALGTGRLFETNLHLTNVWSVAHVDVLTRPVVWVLLVFMILMFAMPSYRARNSKVWPRTPCVRRRRSRLLSHYFV